MWNCLLCERGERREEARAVRESRLYVRAEQRHASLTTTVAGAAVWCTEQCDPCVSVREQERSVGDLDWTSLSRVYKPLGFTTVYLYLLSVSACNLHVHVLLAQYPLLCVPLEKSHEERDSSTRLLSVYATEIFSGYNFVKYIRTRWSLAVRLTDWLVGRSVSYVLAEASLLNAVLYL